MQPKLIIVPVKNIAAAEAEMNAYLRAQRLQAVKNEFARGTPGTTDERNEFRADHGRNKGRHFPVFLLSV